MKTLFTTGEIVGLAEWIIDDACLFLQLEKLIRSNYYLNLSAKEAFKAYVRAYESHSLKQIFDVQTLDLIAVGKSFGFESPPHIDLGVGASKKNRPRKNDIVKNKRDKKSKIYRQVNKSSGKGFSRWLFISQ